MWEHFLSPLWNEIIASVTFVSTVWRSYLASEYTRYSTEADLPAHTQHVTSVYNTYTSTAREQCQKLRNFTTTMIRHTLKNEPTHQRADKLILKKLYFKGRLEALFMKFGQICLNKKS